MSKHVVIAGIGMGSLELLTEQVKKDIKKAQVIIGASRMLALAKELLIQQQAKHIPQYVQSYQPSEIAEYISFGKEEWYCVLMSGDTGFYSGAKKLAKCLGQVKDCEIELHAGISSLSYLCAAFGKDYSEVVFASTHGREENLAYKVRTNRLTFLVTDGDGAEIAKHLCEYGLSDVTLYVGCQLSYEEETLFTCAPKDYTAHFSKQSIVYKNKKCLLSMLIENKHAQNSMSPLREEDFVRGKVPMTKAEIRSQISAMIDVAQDGILYDIGAGTGGVTMELAKKVPDGKVYAIECNKEATALITRNKHRFSMDQVEVVEGMAPHILQQLPKADAVFIGGSKGKLTNILKVLRTQKRGERLTVVVSAITMETLQEMIALTANEKDSLLSDVEIMQLQASHMVRLGKYHKLEQANPIWLAKGYL
jgi:precorrin-6Y C5,15-methyltransferase (decarboxylating)